MPPVYQRIIEGVSWSLERGTAAVDYCEENYVVLASVAEFWNTVTSIFFFLVPPVLASLHRDYAREVDSTIQLLWASIVVVGVGTAHFHAHLSLFGQLLDEISIVWMLAVALAGFVPRRYVPAFLQDKDGRRTKFKLFMLIISLVGTAVVCIKPALNAFILMVFGLPLAILLTKQSRRFPSRHVISMYRYCIGMCLLAIASFSNDKFLCPFWRSMNFPYFHGVWHLCILLAAYPSMVLLAYLQALEEVPQLSPKFMFWPSEKLPIGLPYVKLRRSGTSD